MPVAQLEQIWQRNYDFCKNDFINKKIFEIFETFEIFLAHSTRLDKPEKTALAEFLRFLALKKVFSNHQMIQDFTVHSGLAKKCTALFTRLLCCAPQIHIACARAVNTREKSLSSARVK